jgi:hypothetical protein
MNSPSRDPWKVPPLDRLREGFVQRAAADAAAQRRTRRRRGFAGVAAAAAAVLAIVLGGVIPRTGDTAAAAAIADAPGAVRHARTLSFDTRISLLLPGAPAQTSFERGTVDYKADSYSGSFGDGRQRASQRIAVGADLYERNPVRSSRWLHQRLASAYVATGSGGMGGAALTSPTALLAVIGDAAADFAPVKPGRHYVLTTSARRLASMFDLASPSAQALGSIKLVLAVWLDAKGRPTRERHVFTNDKTGARLIVSSRFTRYGKPLVVARPPAVQVRAFAFTPGTFRATAGLEGPAAQDLAAVLAARTSPTAGARRP